MNNLIGFSALKKNTLEAAIRGYKKIIGTNHTLELTNQRQKMLINCSISNRVTHLGMLNSDRVA